MVRFPLLRTLLPRVTAPILPVTRLRPPSRVARPISGSRLFSHFPARLSSSSPPPTNDRSKQPLSQRLKHLIKSYGWYALGVYLILSALDFGVAFASINLLGAQQVSEIASSVKQAVANVIHSKPPEPGRDEVDPTRNAAQGGKEGLYAMLVLAYTIHKTLFLPVRVGLTAALTPRLVNWLRVRGWAGGEGTRRAAGEMRERLRKARNKDKDTH
ncbi:hypothetical protein E1B28_009916 [Marasmius oreades]|uniref:DUF1279 domain-containing protein n=1 Tax=Marasmius oreades TaxID=181124 RepID=A0A9P7RW12_9AGAR|nr:uncharacterized protein E1B28_009916 [Marasmius oreades]KAG7090834.1 hypothetical protein E1B28_009916 [Marasmius oreades]